MGQDFVIKVGGYYSRQNWGFDRIVNGWAGTAGMNLPLSARWSLSSEFYRGAAIGGFGADLGRSVVCNGPLSASSTTVLRLNSVGGWAQLKFRLTPKLEFNGTFGQDSPLQTISELLGCKP